MDLTSRARLINPSLIGGTFSPETEHRGKVLHSISPAHFPVDWTRNSVDGSIIYFGLWLNTTDLKGFGETGERPDSPEGIAHSKILGKKESPHGSIFTLFRVKLMPRI